MSILWQVFADAPFSRLHNVVAKYRDSLVLLAPWMGLHGPRE